jgi:formylmethanofuran dehydrogenase subunit E
VTTAGLSVDPDDVTRQALVDAGCTDMLYGAPILPGAMTLLAKNKNVQILGVPACGLYYTTTSLDILLPRLLANQTISRADISNYGHGGFCRGCKTCTFPNCSFGK